MPSYAWGVREDKASTLAVAYCAGAAMDAQPDIRAQLSALAQAVTSLQSQVTALQADNSRLRAESAWDRANSNAHVVELQTKLDASLSTTRVNKTIGKVH